MKISIHVIRLETITCIVISFQPEIGDFDDLHRTAPQALGDCAGKFHLV